MVICLQPQCQKPNPDTGKFCIACGRRLYLQDRYRALEPLGQGGFGRTFLAEDWGKPSHPRCVIKQFSPQGIASGDRTKAVELFQQEAIRLEEMGHHPQIPQLLAHCEQEEQRYIIQEFIAGQTLTAYSREHGPLREEEVRQFLGDLLGVLSFIHEHQVIHRDIKPDNIIRRYDGQWFLVDFGAAKQATATALAKTGTMIGSAAYAAPEQMFGHAVFASDLYSLGVTCLYLLTQVEPFTLYSPMESRFGWRVFREDRPIGEPLGRILDKMTEQRVADRYVTAAAVLADLLPPVAPSPRKKRSSLPRSPGEEPKQELKPIVSPDLSAMYEEMLPGGVPLEMMLMPAGRFLMGSPTAETDRKNDEGPQHWVQIPRPFYLGRYPITQGQWRSLMGKNPAHFQKGDDYPVDSVTWQDCLDFLEKLKQHSGRSYRLPSEAEWEYACRAGTTSRFFFGEDAKDLKDYAWFDGNATTALLFGATRPVGQKRPNPWGLYDMAGNVREWCSDTYAPDYETKRKQKPYKQGDPQKRVLRGGSFFWFGDQCRCAARHDRKTNDIGDDNNGLRVACFPS